MSHIASALLNLAMQDRATIETIVGVFAFAAIHSMPERIPTSFQEIWTWVRDSLQTAIPIRTLATSTATRAAGPPETSK